MIDLAKEKFNAENVEFYCADVETYNLQEKANKIVVFNAFPHFIEPQKIIENLACNLQEGGRMTIAHDMGRAQLDFHHSGTAKEVSKGLVTATETAKFMEKYFDVDIIIDEDDIYVVSGVKKKN